MKYSKFHPASLLNILLRLTLPLKLKLILTLTLILTFSISSFAQKENKFVRKGNKAFEKADYSAAAESYRRGVEKNIYSYEANFNLGDALYEQEEYESAANQFDLLRQPGTDKNKLAKVYHNLGNSLLEQQKYSESVEAYKEALRNNPSDVDTRYNLVYAQQKLNEQQQNSQNQEQQNEQQNEEDQSENQEQEQQQNEDGEQQEQQEQQNAQNQEDQQNQQQEQNQQPQQNDKISREEAARILQALQMDEQQLHKDLKKKKMKGQKVKIVKDW